MGDTFSVTIGKDRLGFSAAHFVAYPGFRESLHGHNYRISVTVEGRLGGEGYVVDFLELEKISSAICAELHGKVLLPHRSDCLAIEESAQQITVRCEGGERFLFPREDVCLLPLIHTSSEELSRYFVSRVEQELRKSGREWRAMAVTVEDIPGQEARYEE